MEEGRKEYYLNVEGGRKKRSGRREGKKGRERNEKGRDGRPGKIRQGKERQGKTRKGWGKRRKEGKEGGRKEEGRKRKEGKKGGGEGRKLGRGGRTVRPRRLPLLPKMSRYRNQACPSLWP